MTLESDQCRGGRVPTRVVDALQSVRVQPGLLGETFLGYAGELEVRTDALNGADNHAPIKSTSQCDLQGLKHTGMGFSSAIPSRMSKTPDEKRDILRSFMRERDLKVARWAKSAAVSANSLYNFLNGHSDDLDPRTYAKLARAAEVPVWRLTGDQPEPPSPTSIWVVGQVEAGAFREAVEWDQSSWYSIDVPVPVRFRRLAKALEMRGQSMNLEYPEGAIVIWVDMLDARPPVHGDHVIAYSYAKDGTIEATVKELRVEHGRRWLWPRSTSPEHQSPVNVDDPGEGVDRIEIKGLVLGGYKPRIM